MADLKPDRYIEGPSLGLELYREVAALPIVSPHGHIDAHLFADSDARLDPAGRLFVTADHYVVRMLFSQGVRLADARQPHRPVRADADGTPAPRDARERLGIDAPLDSTRTGPTWPGPRLPSSC